MIPYCEAATIRSMHKTSRCLSMTIHIFLIWIWKLKNSFYCWYFQSHLDIWSRSLIDNCILLRYKSARICGSVLWKSASEIRWVFRGKSLFVRFWSGVHLYKSHWFRCRSMPDYDEGCTLQNQIRVQLPLYVVC